MSIVHLKNEVMAGCLTHQTIYVLPQAQDKSFTEMVKRNVMPELDGDSPLELQYSIEFASDKPARLAAAHDVVARLLPANDADDEVMTLTFEGSTAEARAMELMDFVVELDNENCGRLGNVLVRLADAPTEKLEQWFGATDAPDNDSGLSSVLGNLVASAISVYGGAYMAVAGGTAGRQIASWDEFKKNLSQMKQGDQKARQTIDSLIERVDKHTIRNLVAWCMQDRAFSPEKEKTESLYETLGPYLQGNSTEDFAKTKIEVVLNKEEVSPASTEGKYKVRLYVDEGEWRDVHFNTKAAKVIYLMHLLYASEGGIRVGDLRKKKSVLERLSQMLYPYKYYDAQIDDIVNKFVNATGDQSRNYCNAKNNANKSVREALKGTSEMLSSYTIDKGCGYMSMKQINTPVRNIVLPEEMAKLKE